MFTESLRIGAGAALGALARFALLGLFADQLWPILAINLSGALLMGVLRPGAFLGAGVLGGFTTFSTFITLTLMQSPWGAVGHLAVTALGCTAAWLAGDALHRAYRRPGNPA